MARQLRLEYPGALWHVTSRGNERRDIYFDDHDRRSFLEMLADVVVLHDWILHAWVLMRNHYHLLVETPRAPTLSRGVKRLNERYAHHVNTRHLRAGHLFQGRFKGIIVEKEAHLLELIRYIVLNPVRCGAVRHAGDWAWSNYRSTAGLASAPSWLEIDWALAQFDERNRVAAHEKYRHFVADGRGAAYKPWEDLVGQLYLGGAAFCDRMQALVNTTPRSQDHPRGQRRLVTPSFDAVIASVAEAFGVGSIDGLRRARRSQARKALAHLAWREGDIAIRAVGEWLGVTPGAVSKLIRGSEQLETHDANYRGHLDRLRTHLRDSGNPRKSDMGGEESAQKETFEV